MLTAGPKDDITNQLLSRFKDMISQGLLVPGVKLPPERELAQRFGVSRSSLRHALKALEIMGVLRQRVGDGTYLTSSTRILSEPFEFLIRMDGISLLDLADTRLIVEPELAARAAERATSDDLAILRRSLDAPLKPGEERRQIENDLAFHEVIYRASGNVLCQRLFTLIHEALGRSVSLTANVVDWKHTLSFHRPIYAAIEKRLPDEARRAMAAHLTDARRLIEAVETVPPKLQFPESITPIRKSTPASR
jgi:GntR family transcriptional repressor for pyruvate dehydrogenase complex